MSDAIKEQFKEHLEKNIIDVFSGSADASLARERFRSWFKNLTADEKQYLREHRHEVEEITNRAKNVVDLFAQEVPYLLL